MTHRSCAPTSPSSATFDADYPPQILVCRTSCEFDGDEDRPDDWAEPDGLEAPVSDDEPFDPEPTDDEILDDFELDDETDDDTPPPDELWSDADWE